VPHVSTASLNPSKRAEESDLAWGVCFSKRTSLSPAVMETQATEATEEEESRERIFTGFQ
jgi:hypothetical protein